MDAQLQPALRHAGRRAAASGTLCTDWAYRSKINFFLYESVEFTGKPLLEGGVRVGYIWGNGKYEAAAFVPQHHRRDPRRRRHRLQQPDRLHQRAAHVGRAVQGELLIGCITRRRRSASAAAALAVLLALALGLAPSAARTEPAVIFELGGKFDRSFNQAASDGAERWKRDTGKPYLEFEITNAAQREQAARRFAERGANPVVGIGFPQASSIDKVAREFPKTQFAIVDAVVDLPNVQSFVYREHEGSFLVGMLAALASKTGKVGFVGGMDVPLVRKFLCGYEQGARYVNPKVELLSSMTGNTPAAWTDPARGAELAKAQIAQGVDVVFSAAGTTGIGIMQAVKDAGKLAIGVDSNQNHLHPGTILTSMVKRVDLAVYSAFNGVKPGITALGLKEGALDYAMDEHNARLVSAEMKTRVEAARADIVAGRLRVVDYTVSNACR